MVRQRIKAPLCRFWLVRLAFPATVVVPGDPCATAASRYSVGLHVAFALFTQLLTGTAVPAASFLCPRVAALALVRVGAGARSCLESQCTPVPVLAG